jgi:DNA invertase Pin-like site-specific DNA recombinase
MPFPQGADPKHRFNATLTALLAVNKAEVQAIDEKLKAAQAEKERRKKRSINE